MRDLHPIIFEDSRNSIGFHGQENLTTHFHYHAEMIISREGSFGAVVDGESVTVEEGCAVIVFPFQLHEYKAIDSKKTAIMLLSPACDPKLLKIFMSKLPKSCLISHDKIDGEVLYAANMMWKNFETNPPHGDIIASTYCQLIFQLVLGRLEYRELDASGNIDSLGRILSWINEHSHEHINLETTAKAIGLSASRITHLMNERLGFGFREYLNMLRVQTVINHLCSTEYTVSEIALEAGFTNFTSFNRTFKMATGLSPRDYRNKVGNSPLFPRHKIP